MKIYIDGRYYEKDEAKISVYDHGLLYGDGVFEGIRIYSGKIFKLKEHIQRLYSSAKAIFLSIGMEQEQMEKTVQEAVTLNQKHNGYIRLVVTRGIGCLGVDPFKCPKPTVIIITDDIQLYPKEYYEQGIAVITSSYRRIPPDCFDTRIKSLNYLNNVLAKIEAVHNGCMESLMLNLHGEAAECTADNVFVVKNSVILTPHSLSGALEGITRQTVFELAQKAGLPIQEKSLSRYDLYNADECFLTGTGAEIMPIIQIDKRAVGDGKPGPITKKTATAFSALVHG